MSENENVSLEDLSIESFIETDFDPDSITLNDLFEDRLSFFNSSVQDDLSEQGLFDIDLECGDLDKVWITDCDINDSIQFDDINLNDFDPNQPAISVENNDVYANDTISANDNESSDSDKKNSTVIRRQSTRIQNQTRKKIAEQIQRENIRLAKEAQLLNNHKYSRKKAVKSPILVNGNPPSPATEKYLAHPTDLDAEAEEEQTVEEEVDTTSANVPSNDVENDEDNNDDIYNEDEDDDPNKLWCICRQPYGRRFMICCDNCLEWYHGDCVGVTQQEGSMMDEFICPPCVKNAQDSVSPVKSEQIVIIDDDDDVAEISDDDKEVLEPCDDDCLIVKAVQPMKFTSNIFQLLKKTSDGNCEPDKPQRPKPQIKNVPSLSSRTSVCLNQGCKTLVNPKKSLYCSKICIDKYTRMVIKNNLREKLKQYGLPKGPKLAKMTRFVLAQPDTETIQDEFTTPTEENLKDFLLQNPTYKVYQSSEPAKTKQDKEKSKKFLELLNMDPSKHIKIVKHFAILFKKSMPLKSFNAEFRNIWQHCVKMEATIFEICDKTINDKYMLKVKQLSESLKNENTNKLCWDILHGKLAITDLLSLNKEQLETRSKIVVLEDQGIDKVFDKPSIPQKKFVATRGGISALADTTHLHGKHLYDINCKVCNGASKSEGEIKAKEKQQEKQAVPPMENVISSCSEIISLDDIPSPINNDEYKVTSSVATPDMAVDMEICSTPSDKDGADQNPATDINSDSKVDSSSKDLIITSVVLKPQKRKLVSLWEGELTYKEVGSVVCKSYLVTRMFLDKKGAKEGKSLSGSAADIREEINIGSSLENSLSINGRSDLVVVQDYFLKLRKHSNKEFIILRLHPANLEEGRQTYLSMFEYFHSRERCGVISHKKMGVKDCFIYPLNAHAKIPQMFLPFIGPGLEKSRPHLLLLLIVRSPLTYQYKPISPKYDQDHDFVKKHGINLDKYYKPNPNPPFCPSPIEGTDKIGKLESNHKTALKKEVGKVEVLENDPKNESREDSKEKLEEDYNNKPMEESNETSNHESAEKPQEYSKNNDLHGQSTEELPRDDLKVIDLCDSIDSPEMSTLDLLDIPLPPPLPDIEVKKPAIISYPVKAPSLPLKDITSSSSPGIISQPIKVTTFPTTILSSPIITAKSPVTTTAACSVTTQSPSPSFSPQPFVYRSIVKPAIKVPENPNNPAPQADSDIRPLLHGVLTNQELICDARVTHFSMESPVEDRKYLSPHILNQTPVIPITDQISKAQTCSDTSFPYTQDVDLRFPALTAKELSLIDLDEQLIEVDSRNLFLKRKDSDRLYTFYDSFPSDEGCYVKRRKYFFNPHNPVSVSAPPDQMFSSQPQSPCPGPGLVLQPPQHSSIAHSTNDQKICDGIVLKKNMSVFSPPGDSYRA